MKFSGRLDVSGALGVHVQGMHAAQWCCQRDREKKKENLTGEKKRSKLGEGVG